MQSHEVIVDRSVTPARISFAPVFNISAVFLDRHIAAGRGGEVAIRSARRQSTYADLADGTFRMAAALRRLGVSPGDRVIIAVTDSPAFYFAFLATVRIGAVAVPASTFMKRDNFAYMIAESQSKAVVASPICLAELDAALQTAGSSVVHRIAVDAAPAGWLPLADLLSDNDPVAEPEPTTPHSDCFWLYSSGSTGEPKASVHQHKDMVYTSVHFAETMFRLSADDVIFSVGKLFFAYGINNSLAFPLWAGATVILMEERVTAENALELIATQKPTIYFSVSTLMVQQVAAIERGFPADWRSVRISTGGGEVVPPTLYDNWRRVTGLDLLEAIGSSEALHVYICNEIGRTRRGSLGRAVPGYDIMIVDDDDRPVTIGEPGEIIIRGGSVATYYWNKPQKTAQAMRNGWFHTGDTAYQDADGFFYFCGRKDDLLRVGGMWVSPSEVEAALVAHPMVSEAAVVGALDQNQLVKPKAFVVLRDRDKASPGLQSELLSFVNGQLAGFKCPKWIEFRPDLPKTVTGKIERFRLRAESARV